jgi:hypothetical protein
MADDEYRLVLVAREPGDDRMVVGEPAITADLDELREQAVHIIEHGWSARVARHEHPLPRRQIPVEIPADRLDPLVEAVDRLLPLWRRRHHRHGLDLLHQQRDWFLEFERFGRHSSSVSVHLACDRAGHNSQLSTSNSKLQTPNLKTQTRTESRPALPKRPRV